MPGFQIRVDPGVSRSATTAGREIVVATLEEALDVLRQRRRAGRDGEGGALIAFAGGVHRLAEPVRIEKGLGGLPGQPLVLRGAADGSTRIVGSVPLAPVDEPLPGGVDPQQRSRVRSYRLPRAAADEPSINVHRIHPVPSPPLGLEIFDAQGALMPARWPNAGWAHLALPDEPPKGAEATDPTILLPEGRAARWRDEGDLWIAGYLGQDWSFETLPALALPPAANRLALLGTPHYPLRPKDRFYVENALAELDAPGEWWRDTKRGLVLLIPRQDSAGPIEVSVASGLIAIDGASHVRLEGLTLERTRGDAVVVTGGDDVVLEDCTLRWTGGRGLVITDAVRSGLRRSVVAETGEGGVTLTGGDRARLVPGGNFVEDSVLVRFSRLGRTYKAAVSVDGVGMRVTGNLVAHAPHLAILFQGNDHEIARNEIYDVVRESSDASAIYTGRDITAQGTRLSGNFLHDIRPEPGFEVKGIYLDDMASGLSITGNLFLRVDQPVFIGGGRDNTVMGNTFVGSPPAFFLDGRGEVWAGPPITSSANTVRAAFDSVLATRPPWSTRYPLLAGLLSDRPLAAKRNVFRDNLLVSSGAPQIEAGADPRLQTVGANRTLEAPEAARAPTLAALEPILATDRTIPHALDAFDRAAILSRIATLKRRAGHLLTRDGSP
ncbi:right-handed parallel beta-helix repeat-containing protein [Methylobacterium sp. J-078]|uniref:right-handed parallel beta-helix repeat-containing protein n=1 Tax=Methylobacterium sp. J-078 TaxID=2836657 RepID=UPI001FBB443E|nr:right-handed parallel beta-helix repeat-containing protein [Methylobacterium sp. J-078]MCJ2044179.1 right-handed parallel beta-helix repeat-containing protein [Methylobacterium sp. J-078]